MSTFLRPIRARQKQFLALILALALAVGGLLAYTASRAGAKDITNAITSVDVSPKNPKPTDTVTVNLTWSVPTGTEAGDTFDLVIPSVLGDFPSGFDLRDPANNLVATAKIVGHKVTFTLTDYAATHQHVTGTAFFTSQVTPGTAPGLTHLHFTGSIDKTVDITIGGTFGRDRTVPDKFGYFYRNDQGTSNPTDAVIWAIETPVGPFDTTTITDKASTGQAFDCANVQARLGDATGPNGAFNNGVLLPLGTDLTCSTTSLSYTYDTKPVPAGKLIQLAVPVTLTNPRLTTFEDTATVTTDGVVKTAGAKPVIRTSAGGTGNGDLSTPGVKIVKKDAAGNDADTAADKVTLPTGSTQLVYTITNAHPDGTVSNEALVNVHVYDEVQSNGTVSDLSCNLPDGTTLANPDAAAGITWPGPFAIGDSFTCTANLAGVVPGTDHQDTGHVNGAGEFSGVPVSDTNPYFASNPGKVNVGDYVWIDTNHDGIQDADEKGIPNVKLTLTDADGKSVTDINGDAVGSATTDSNGKYGFGELPPGQYIVTIDQASVPTGLFPTVAEAGNDREKDSSTGSATSKTLVGGQQDLSLDFGFWTPAPTILIVKKDAAGNDADTAATKVILPNGSTDLVYTVTNTGNEALKNIVVSDTVVSNGRVTGQTCDFSKLGGPSSGLTWAAGPLLPGASVTCTATLSDVAQGDDHQDVGNVTAVGVVSGLPAESHNPYFASNPGKVSVGDYVWFDSNHNGIQDTDEPGIPGVTLTLTDAAGQPVTDIKGQPVGPQVTDSTGKYLFSDLPPGQYVVTIDKTSLPTGDVATLADQGSDRTVDSDTDSAKSSVLSGGENDLSLDFGFVSPVSVGDYVWIDKNHNGIQDAGEKGLPGVTLTLTDSAGQPVTDLTGAPVAPTETDADGKYGFSNLPPGTYTVSVLSSTVPDEYQTTVTGAGTRETDSSDGSATSLALAGGDSDLSLDFGFFLTEFGVDAVALTPPSSGTDDLAFTGVNSVGPLALAAAMLGLGIGFLLFAQRRRRSLRG
ncbi:SdrD B-like domain-containing protein [Jatrophihabitans sp. GAS493]|uniref:SdrD B-like domain-containing protein n=1 Tax=Jatrophihabitans sp. GAS493 TaxID=1907575 RepID=UPI0012FD1A0C|nr:SdrD B-like domain-containing protein [Jatrophihabitans sp. GAS493]